MIIIHFYFKSITKISCAFLKFPSPIGSRYFWTYKAQKFQSNHSGTHTSVFNIGCINVVHLWVGEMHFIWKKCNNNDFVSC